MLPDYYQVLDKFGRKMCPLANGSLCYIYQAHLIKNNGKYGTGCLVFLKNMFHEAHLSLDNIHH